MFVNVPYDASYERLFIGLIAALLSLGRKPRCVLEIPETGAGRLTCIQGLLESCRVSIHDLSRVGTPARFNMPFEAGLACSLKHHHEGHIFVLLEKEEYRLDKTLSDLKGIDPYTHHGTQRGAIKCVFDALTSSRTPPTISDVQRLAMTMSRTATFLKSESGKETVFSRSIYQALVSAGLTVAANRRLIQP